MRSESVKIISELIFFVFPFRDLDGVAEMFWTFKLHCPAYQVSGDEFARLIFVCELNGSAKYFMAIKWLNWLKRPVWQNYIT